MLKYVDMIIPLVVLLTFTNAVYGETSNTAAARTLLNRCTDFKDYRNFTRDGDSILIVPANLTNTNETATFGIKTTVNEVQCTKYFSKTVKWEHGTDLIRQKSHIRGNRLKNSSKFSSYFTQEGYFHEKNFYYHLDDYCVQSINDTEITLRICNASCGGEGKMCIPKCCGVDEVLVYWNFTCRKITPQESKWRPSILSNLSYPYNEVNDQTETDRIQIYRKILDCPFFEKSPLSNTSRPTGKGEMDYGVKWKLLSNGTPAYYHTKTSSWDSIPDGTFCVDGFANWGNAGNGTYSGNEKEHSVLLFCPSTNSSFKEANNVTPLPIVERHLNRCPDFTDHRLTFDDNFIVTIPANLTNSDETVHFGISNQPYTMPCAEFFFKTVKWEHGKRLVSVKSKMKGERLRHSGKSSSHFTHGGYYHENNEYYKPEDFCVKSVNEAEIELRVCNVTCGKEGRICIPKCCGVDEILVYWNFTCRKIKGSESKWNPLIHKPSDIHRQISNQKDLDNIHLHRQRLGCDVFEQWPLTNALRARIKNEMDFEVPWKILPNKRPIFLTYYRKWTEIPEGEYCVDGFANWGFGGNGTFSGREEEHSVLLICPKLHSSPKFHAWKAWVYSSILIIASIFLLLTAIVHLLLLDKQHLHGLTVLCHSISMFLMYVFVAIAHIVSIYDNLKGKPRSGFCLSIAILSHYFFMTSFTWLSIMNFDLWLTFRSMRPVSKMSKRIRRFRLYSLIGWGLPAILSSIFYTIDVVYRDRKTEVVVPDYADKNCFVAIYARGFYMYSLVAIALSFNTVLVLSTFYIFYEFRKQNANTFTTKRTKSDKYSVRLFVKLFCVMGVAWFVELLSWYYNGEAKPWPVVVLDCIMFFQALAIFFIFCINRRTLKQLEDKYSCLKKTIGPLRKFQWFMYSDADGVEMTTPGSSPRKLSLSVTTNTKIDSTLPRKTSTSSTRSGSTSSNNKYMINGKGRLETLESVSLDSESEPNVVLESHSKIQRAPDLVIVE